MMSAAVDDDVKKTLLPLSISSSSSPPSSSSLSQPPPSPSSASSSSSSSSKEGLFQLKYLALLILVVQNSALALTMRYSRTAAKETGGVLFIASTAVVVSEVLKLFASSFLVAREEGGTFAKLRHRLYQEIIGRPREMLKLLVPSLLYVLQNNLAYIAVSNLDAASYQVLYQLKILTTALFSVLLLRRRLDSGKWLALVILVGGVSLVQLSGQKQSTTSTQDADDNTNNPVLGLVCVLLACLSSGFAGVYFEKVLKDSAVVVSVWVRNVQLALIGIVISLLTVYNSPDAATVHERGFFAGYTRIVWGVVVLQALGGLLVAVVIKYADNLLKGFATSLSIVLSCVLSVLLFADFELSLMFLAGTGLVIMSTLLYSSNGGVGGMCMSVGACLGVSGGKKGERGVWQMLMQATGVSPRVSEDKMYDDKVDMSVSVRGSRGGGVGSSMSGKVAAVV